MLAQHIKRFKPNRIWSVFGDLQLELRRGKRCFLHNIKNDERKRIVSARAILVRTTKIDGMPPIVVDGSVLPGGSCRRPYDRGAVP